MSVRGFFGGLFLTIGWLIAILSGGCTVIYSAFLVFGVLFRNARLSEFGEFLSFAIPVGGIPFIVGVIIIWIGRLIRGEKEIHLPRGSNPYAIPEEMRDAETQRLKENLKNETLLNEEKY